MSQFSKTFCVLPWLHYHVGPQGLSSVCCDANEYTLNFGFVNEEDPLKEFYSDKMKGIRQAMLAGEEVKGCDRCYQNENNGIRSARQFYNEQVFPKEAEQFWNANSTESTGIISIDFRADNSCNLKCRTCNPLYSSAISAEEKAIGKIPNKPEKVSMSIMNLFDKVDFSKIRRMYFAGGEPLLARDHIKFLKELIQRGNTDIELVYTTNVSRFSHHNFEVLDLWAKFRHVVLGLSLDSWGSRAEYIRTGQDWNQVEKDIKISKKLLPNAYIFASCTISALNLFTLPDFIEKLVSEGYFKYHQFHLHMVYEPFEYRIDGQGKEYKERGSKILKEYIARLKADNQNELAEKINGVLHFLNNEGEPDRSSALIKDNLDKDSRRHTSFEKTFPELDFLIKK